MIGWIIIGAIVLLFIVLASLYKIVPADMADVVIRGGATQDEQGKVKGNMRVYSGDANYSGDGKSAYFRIPSWFFLFNLGMTVHRIPLKIIPISVSNFLAFDKDRARFECNIIAYVTVNKPIRAAQRFSGSPEQLIAQVSKVVQATTRDATTKKAIREIINDRDGIIATIKEPLTNALGEWGLNLNDIELVEFKDPEQGEKEGDKPSHVISDISSIIEEQINSEARQKNAEQKKVARLKEAVAEEEAKKRELTRDEEIGKRDAKRLELISAAQALAKVKELEIVKVQQVKTQEIEKERQLVEAEQRKQVEMINKEQKKLVGEGTRAQQEEEAKGLAAPIREKGFAEAEAKEKLQAALNKFGDEAIRALVAEKIVAMQEAVGLAGAEALKSADLKVFSGGDGAKQGFELGQMIEGIVTSNQGSADAVLNRLSKPHDLGISLGAATAVVDAVKKVKKDKKAKA